MWFVFGLLSAFFLGCYDISKKISLRDNAVVPVLFSSVACSALLLLPFCWHHAGHPKQWRIHRFLCLR